MWPRSQAVLQSLTKATATFSAATARIGQLCWLPGRQPGVELSSSLAKYKGQLQMQTDQALPSQAPGQTNKYRSPGLSFLSCISSPLLTGLLPRYWAFNAACQLYIISLNLLDVFPKEQRSNNNSIHFNSLCLKCHPAK